MSSDKSAILIVDDISSNIQVLANALQADHRIKVATNGDRALEICRSETPPDLILLDIMMPDMDGYEVCRKLKSDAETSSIPIIFVTALSEVNDEEKGLNLGAVDYITKPFHLPIVKIRVRNHLNLKLKTDLLEEMSHIDGLTHIANRRNFDEVMEKEARRIARIPQPISLIMLDIDFFKAFNDNYGHGLGDDCLVQVASAMREVIKRPHDLLARYGGEEFAVILPETGLEGALKVAEELRRAVEMLGFSHAFSEVADHVTISLGVASNEFDKQASIEKLLKQADQALYKAKESGRNQVAH
ncbi:MAG: diguanylate cyclase [Thiomicrospira sp.]|uniref:diguanylate cyclase n=1 Tax=Thiomicrospira sp. TaxID=935 RepID=UPI0019FD531B|nr:diguanylate cyclase [Thiomicrospira sp.]MBE0493827.1 diguanylate cyclase [Thiomicrospira sp.]